MGYYEFHEKRWAYLLDLLERYLHPDSSILDIGRSPLTALLFERYRDLTTLGFPLEDTQLDKLVQIPQEIPHIEFDLNDSGDPEKWVELPRFDAIIFAEVLEHLYVAPEHVFSFLKSGLKAGGYLVLQTPNATAIGKRLKMIMGIHSYERIRKGDDPGHFREYTKNELLGYSRKAGFKVIMHEYKNYFGLKGPSRLLYFVTSPYPPFRQGQTLILKLEDLDD